jgi:hypothetical protein
MVGTAYSSTKIGLGIKRRKKTLLYIVGVKPMDLPIIPISFDAIEYTVSSKIKKKTGRRIKKEITKKEREATPINLAKWLIEVAIKCNHNVNKP